MVAQNTVLILLAFLGFGVVHSLTAGIAPKNRLKALFGERLVEGWYRLAYNLFSGLTFLPVLLLIALLPDRELYRIGMPWALIFGAIQLVGVAGLLGAFFIFDVWRFLGIKQAFAFLSGEPLPLPPEPLQIKGLYTLTRHPLYSFSLLVIWFTPIMTLNVLLFNICATLYIIFGSLVEEGRMERAYGEQYRAYRRRVSWLIPWPPRRDDSF
ncbi:MAG: methyltransferase [Candidatus Hadarchaeum sp.]